jgi:hypothetical protein
MAWWAATPFFSGSASKKFPYKKKQKVKLISRPVKGADG